MSQAGRPKKPVPCQANQPAIHRYFGTGVTVVPSRAAPSDDTMDIDVGEGAHEHVAGQGGARQDYDDWDSSESDDGFCIQTDRSQGAEDE